MGENPKSGRNFAAVGAGGSSVGGAAAIYGFVHQILASIGQLVRAQFGSIGAKTDPNTIIAILEPSAGGDLSLEAAARKVIQFKHRAKSVSISDVGGRFCLTCTARIWTAKLRNTR